MEIKGLYRFHGFTLLELLIVLAVLGILSTMALPGFGRMVETSRVRDAQTTLNMIFQAERIYRLEQNNRYGTLTGAVGPGGVGNPDPGTLVVDPVSNLPSYLVNPNVNNGTWTYVVTETAGPPPTFLATATRNGGAFNAQTISLDRTFTGSPLYPDGTGRDRIYNGGLGGTVAHDLRD